MLYKPIYTLQRLKTYLSGVSLRAFDFETALDDKYRYKVMLKAHRIMKLTLNQNDLYLAD